MKKEIIKFLSISFIILIVDLFSKYIFSIYKEVTIINNFLMFKFTKNTGVAFSLLENKQPLVILISLLMLVYLTKESINYIKNKKSGVYISFSFIIGGLLGNLVDRIIFGYVRDFISFKIGSYLFPIFNIADSFLVIGAFMLVYFVVKDEKNENKSKKRRNKKN